jgi:hypothetical protein
MILFDRHIHCSIKAISRYIHISFGAIPIQEISALTFRISRPPLWTYWMTLRRSVTPVLQEEELRCSGDPKFSHLSDDLHVEITAFAPPAEAHARIAYALAEVRRFLVPVSNPLCSCITCCSWSSTALYRVRCGWLIICCSGLELNLQSHRDLYPNYIIRRRLSEPQRHTQPNGAPRTTASEELKVRTMYRGRHWIVKLITCGSYPFLQFGLTLC